MKYVAEIGTGTMTYTPSFITTGSGIQKLIGGGERLVQTNTDSKVIS
jgi:hypothetical protein